MHIFTCNMEHDKISIENYTRGSIPSSSSSNYGVLLMLILIFMGLSALVTKKKKSTNGLEKIPGPKPIPLLGNVFEVETNMEKMDKFFLDTQKRYPHKSRFRMFGYDFVILYNAEDIKDVLHGKNYLDKGEEYDKVFSWIGTGALTASGDKWLRTRPILDLGFRQKLLTTYKSVFCKKSVQLVDVFKDRVKQEGGKPFDVFPIIFDAGYDIISETAMGIPSNCLGGVDPNVYSVFMDKAADYFHFLHFRPFFYKTALGRLIWRISPAYRKEQEVLKVLNNHSEGILRRRKKEVELIYGEEGVEDPTPKEGTSLLDVMLLSQRRDKELWTDKQIRDEIDTFLTGGHGATTATFGMFLQLMATHPTIQDKVYNEVHSILQEYEDQDPLRELSMEELSRLKYSEACIKECLRLYPGVPIFPRKVGKPLFLSKDGILVPQGTTLLISPFVLHRDPSVFPDPEKFIPERWIDQGTSATPPPYSYIPFSAGPRNCIGKQFSMIEMKVYVAYILHSFRIVKAVETKDIRILLRIFLKSKNGIVVGLEERNNND